MLRLENVSKYYGTQKQSYRGVEKINLTIKEGEAVAIVGTSGTGKSTLLNVMSTIDRPTSGQVWLDDMNLTSAKKRERSKIRLNNFGFVFQKFCLIQELSVRENIILPILLSSRKVDEAYIEELCQILGLTDRMTHMPSELSGGQQQRVAIARALANHPSIILCDEQTGNLDHATSEDVMNLLHDIHKRYQKTMVIVTHDPHIAEGADYILQLEDGKIVGCIQN